MADFKVLNILEYNKIKTENWQLGKEEKVLGDIVIINGIPDLDKDIFQRDLAFNRLKITLEGKKVVLRNAKVVDTGVIKCDVFLDDVNVANYFSDYNKSL